MNLWGRRRCLMASNEAPFATVVGSIASFIAKKVTPIKDLVVAIEPVQEGSGDPSPDNVRLITGWTGCKVNVTGVNIAPSSVPSNVIAGTFNATDSKIYSAANARVFAFPVPKNATINVQKKSDSTSGHTIALGDTGDIAVNTPIYSPQGFTNIKSATLTTGSHSWLYVQSSTLAVANELFSIDEFMVILGSGRVDYKASQGTTHSISWETEAGTVYDGYVDATNGKVVRQWTRFDLGSLTWTKNGGRFESNYLANTSTSTYRVTAGRVSIKCEVYKAISNRTGNDFNSQANDFETCFNSSSRPYFMVKDSRFTTAADLKAALSGCYAIVERYKAAEQVYDVDPITVETLKGENNIWADAGDVTVTAAGIKEITLSSAQALNMLLGGMYTNNHTAEDVSDDEALNIILGGSNA